MAEQEKFGIVSYRSAEIPARYLVRHFSNCFTKVSITLIDSKYTGSNVCLRGSFIIITILVLSRSHCDGQAKNWHSGHHS